MKKKSLITLTAAVALVGAIGVGSTLAYFTDNDAKTNVVTMGHVDITLTEEDSDDGTKNEDGGITYTDVVPNTTLDKEPVVTLGDDSQDAYIRVKAEAEFAEAITKDGVDVTEDYADAIVEACNWGENWELKADGYYYYKEKLTQDAKTATLFTTVAIPAAWGNEVADVSFKINITAEAIQADNFEFAEDGTWGDVTVETYGTAAAPEEVVE